MPDRVDKVTISDGMVFVFPNDRSLPGECQPEDGNRGELGYQPEDGDEELEVHGVVDPINRSATIDYQNKLIHGEGVTQGEGMTHSEAHEAFTVCLCATDPPKGLSTGRAFRGDCAAEGRAESTCFTCSCRVETECSLVAKTGSRGKGD